MATMVAAMAIMASVSVAVAFVHRISNSNLKEGPKPPSTTSSELSPDLHEQQSPIQADVLEVSPIINSPFIGDEDGSCLILEGPKAQNTAEAPIQPTGQTDEQTPTTTSNARHEHTTTTNDALCLNATAGIPLLPGGCKESVGTAVGFYNHLGPEGFSHDRSPGSNDNPIINEVHGVPAMSEQLEAPSLLNEFISGTERISNGHGHSAGATRVGSDAVFDECEYALLELSLDEMIEQLPNARPYVKLSSLVDCALKHLTKTECVSMTFLGSGSSNFVYLISFSDGTDVAASIPSCRREQFNASAKESEIATMLYVAESGLYPTVPVPKIYAWDVTYTNVVGSPYVLMEAIHGRQISDLTKVDDGCHLYGLDALDCEDQMTVTRTMARLCAQLSVPVPFNQLGSIINPSSGSHEGSFAVGPLFSLSGANMGGPFASLSDFWTSLLDSQVEIALKEWHDRTGEDLATYINDPHGTPEDFAENLHYLSVLIPSFIPPPQPLVLSHPDISLRNLIFDKDDLTKIAGVLDWAGAAVVPRILSGRFPGDLSSSDRDHPCADLSPPGLGESWQSVPFNWTYAGQRASWPSDQARYGSALVRRYYLRQHFSSYFALQFRNDISCSSLYREAPYYLKFYEVLSGGWRSWFVHSLWISDTFWRVRWKTEGYRGASVIVGPILYPAAVQREPLIMDLGRVDRQFQSITATDNWESREATVGRDDH